MKRALIIFLVILGLTFSATSAFAVPKWFSQADIIMTGIETTGDIAVQVDRNGTIVKFYITFDNTDKNTMYATVLTAISGTMKVSIQYESTTKAIIQLYCLK